jgi:SPP1 family predicted phage head-tail adaptor
MTMNHRVELLKPPAGTDAAGRLLKTWTLLQEVWANVKFQTGAEVIRGSAETSIVKVSIRIRARRDVDASMRARYRGVEYNIRAVLPDSANPDFMFLVCESFK